MPYHLELEKVTQRFLGSDALGTTKRGIGPAYADRAARVGIRVQDLYDEKILRAKLDVVLKEKNQILTKVYGRLAIAPEQIFEDYLGYAERLRGHVADTGRLLHDGLVAGKHVMLEGAQGTMLDLDHGTYPFVTSSTPVTGYGLASAGFGPQHVERVIGITKAYVTRVGAALPTEALDADGERMGERGAEFGTTTGRKRRCGWFDGCVLRYAARLNGLTDVILTKLDVLSGFETLRVCVGYRAGGETWDDVPPNQTLFHEAEPVWEEVPGWADELGDVRSSTTCPRKRRAMSTCSRMLAGCPSRSSGWARRVSRASWCAREGADRRGRGARARACLASRAGSHRDARARGPRGTPASRRSPTVSPTWPRTTSTPSSTWLTNRRWT